MNSDTATTPANNRQAMLTTIEANISKAKAICDLIGALDFVARRHEDVSVELDDMTVNSATWAVKDLLIEVQELSERLWEDAGQE